MRRCDVCRLRDTRGEGTGSARMSLIIPAGIPERAKRISSIAVTLRNRPAEETGRWQKSGGPSPPYRCRSVPCSVSSSLRRLNVRASVLPPAFFFVVPGTFCVWSVWSCSISMWLSPLCVPASLRESSPGRGARRRDLYATSPLRTSPRRQPESLPSASSFVSFGSLPLVSPAPEEHAYASISMAPGISGWVFFVSFTIFVVSPIQRAAGGAPLRVSRVAIPSGLASGSSVTLW